MDNLEKNLERTYLTWEILIQGIRNIADSNRFLMTLAQNRNFFETEFNNKEQGLIKYLSITTKELTENNERLEGLQKQHFAANMTKQLAIRKQTHLIRIRRKNIIQAKIKLNTIHDKFGQKFNETLDNLRHIFPNLQQEENEVQQQGLTPRMIRRFQLFTADESHVGDQCSICIEDIDVGKRMRRLTCDGQHYFCQGCIEGWFAEHNTCPLCRHKFD